MKNTDLHIGDRVCFYWLLDGDNWKELSGNLLYVPQAIGDSWRIEDYNDEDEPVLYLVQNFDYMEKL